MISKIISAKKDPMVPIQKELFLLDPNIIFLNHGSFGATPMPVFEVYQEWQRELERQPVKFLGRELGNYLELAREALGRFLKANPNDIGYIPNATYGVNLVARSLDLQPGDEILSTDHEYGAMDRTFDEWRYRKFLAGCLTSHTVDLFQPYHLPNRPDISSTGNLPARQAGWHPDTNRRRPRPWNDPFGFAEFRR